MYELTKGDTDKVLIESDWNLKENQQVTQKNDTGVLIESDWNLKQI